MKSSSYGERDYAVGELMQTLRTTIGLTQAGLARQLGVSRRAVAEWEGGSTYPKPDHLKALLTFATQQKAFPTGREEEEIRAFWNATRQKLLLDERWLHDLLASVQPTLPSPWAETLVAHTGSESVAFPRIDLVRALDVSHFVGREVEVAELTQWIVQERCRMIVLLGMGGIGKSMLASYLGRQLAPHFEAVLWCSLRDAPPCEDLVADCITFFSETPPASFPTSLEQRISQLLARLQTHRCLLVLDNLESLLQSQDPEGGYLPGYEGYGRLLGRLGESAHQSCVLVTSREKPKEIEPLEGVRSPVRSLRLVGMDEQVAHDLLSDKELYGTPAAWERLVASYAGNPLALKIIAQAISDLFNGDLDRFLQEGELIFNGIRPVLRQQIRRLTPLEYQVLTWLTVLREWTELQTLALVLHPQVLRTRLLEALEALRRRSLLERGQLANFSLQSVVMEYLTDELGERLCEEIVLGDPQHLRQVALAQARAKDYVREIQVRLLVQPLLERLRVGLGANAQVEAQLLRLLVLFRAQDMATQGYGPANVLSLLKELRGHLRGLDLSQLSIRGAYLQGVELQDTSLEGAHLEQVVFSQAFGAIYSAAMSPDGQYWAAGSISGEVRIWRQEGQMAYAVIPAHTHAVAGVAFSPDGSMLASGSWDCTVKVWDVAGKAIIWNFQGHQGYVQSVAFHPAGTLLASGSDDGSIKLWDLNNGRCLHTLKGHLENVYSIAWHPHGHLLASGSFDGTIRIWEMETGTCVRTLTGHTNWVMGVAFAPDGKLLASGGADKLVKLWEVESGRCQHTLSGHTDHVRTVAWTSDGRTLASGSFDTTIRLWHPEREVAQQMLLGHTDLVQTLTCTPDGKWLLSGSEDRTLRVWEISSGQCLRILQGYSVTPLAVTWSPDSRLLANGGTHFAITIWDTTSRRPVKSLQGHTQPVYTLAWHPKGSLIASGSYDHTVRVWNSTTGTLVQVLRAHSSQVTRVAWSPNGAWLASTGYDQVVCVWDISKGTCRWMGQGHTSLISAVSWSPDGTRLATCSDDHTVRLWQAEDGTLLQTLQGHTKDVASVVWSPDGRFLASCGGGGSSGEVLLWDASSGDLLRSLVGHPTHVFAIDWSPQGDILVSAGIDGTLRWWNVEKGECVYVRQGHQGWINSIAISLNGEILASCGHDGLTQLWEMSSAEHLATLRADRPYERLSLVNVTGLTEAQKTTLRALGALEEASV